MTANTLVKTHSTGINPDLFVQPRTSENKFAGLRGDRLKLKVMAKAIDGAANEAACKLIAEYFAVPKSAVHPIVLETLAEKLLFS